LGNIINDTNEWRDKMRRFFKVPAVFAVLVTLLIGSPAFATQVTHHDTHRSSVEEKTGVHLHPTFGTSAQRWSGGNTTHDDWPANMILG
jgi:hypothetical protein